MRYSERHETLLEIAQLILHVITCPRGNRCPLFTVCQSGVYCFTVTGCTQIDLSQQGKQHSSLSQELITGALLVMGSCLSRSAVLPYSTQIIERERERERGGGREGEIERERERERERGRGRGRACSNFFNVMSVYLSFW